MSRIILLTGKMMISSSNFEDVALAKNSSLHICAKETQGDTRTINFSDPADKARHDRMVSARHADARPEQAVAGRETGA